MTNDGAVHMIVALPGSKFAFNEDMQREFKALVKALCSESGEVVIEDTVDKPADFRGGVEFGLMSTTTDRDTAVAYSGVKKKRGTVFEILAGRIDVGASISFLSQYPGEDEFLMQPLCCLEVCSVPLVFFIPCPQVSRGALAFLVRLFAFLLSLPASVPFISFISISLLRVAPAGDGGATAGSDRQGRGTAVRSDSVTFRRLRFRCQFSLQ